MFSKYVMILLKLGSREQLMWSTTEAIGTQDNGLSYMLDQGHIGIRQTEDTITDNWEVLKVSNIGQP